MPTSIRLLAVVPLLIVAAACGSDDATPAADDTTGGAASAPEGTDAGDDTGSDGEATSDTVVDEVADAPATPSGGSGGTATLTLSNGEVFEFSSVLCTLEPQMAAGSEILFTATSYEDPGLDITQFGDEGTITGVASISVYDGEYDSLWEANSMFGTPVELALDGNTITGSGSFLEGGDPASAPVDGDIVATC